ncbi:MAG: hypothetical protein C0501_05175 [Isosphaera sp.]|nr:hypothetical protein [Isosphaera sp.]
MPAPFWKRPGFWGRVEFAAAVAALASGVIAVWDQLTGAIWGSAFAAAVLLANVRQRRLEKKEREEREEFVKRVVGAVLEGLRSEYFTKVDEEDRHNHRVTLFVCQTRAGGDGKELRIYRRAGSFPSSPTAWRVDDDEPGRCEGVAGRVWFHGTKRTVELPEWSEDTAGKEAYAAKGFVGPIQAENLKVKSKVLSGTVVRVFGRKWGVLMLDSRTAGFILPAEEHVVERYAALIGRMLEEGDP